MNIRKLCAILFQLLYIRWLLFNIGNYEITFTRFFFSELMSAVLMLTSKRLWVNCVRWLSAAVREQQVKHTIKWVMNWLRCQLWERFVAIVNGTQELTEWDVNDCFWKFTESHTIFIFLQTVGEYSPLVTFTKNYYYICGHIECSVRIIIMRQIFVAENCHQHHLQTKSNVTRGFFGWMKETSSKNLELFSTENFKLRSL